LQNEAQQFANQGRTLVEEAIKKGDSVVLTSTLHRGGARGRYAITKDYPAGSKATAMSDPNALGWVRVKFPDGRRADIHSQWLKLTNMKEGDEQLHPEVTRTAYELGQTAFKGGKKRAAVLDPKVTQLARGMKVGQGAQEIFAQWNKGWDDARQEEEHATTGSLRHPSLKGLQRISRSSYRRTKEGINEEGYNVMTWGEAVKYRAPKLKGRNPGEVWKTKPGAKSKFGAMNQVNLVRYFDDKGKAVEFSKGKQPASYSGWPGGLYVDEQLHPDSLLESKKVIKGEVSVYTSGRHIVNGNPVKAVIKGEGSGIPSIRGGWGSFMIEFEKLMKQVNAKTGDEVTITIEYR